jgi:hypothetical protein
MTSTNPTKRPRFFLEIVLGLALAMLFSALTLNRVASSSSPYRQLTDVLAKAEGAKVLPLGSYDDFYNLPMPSYLLKQRISAELGYDEVIARASLGEKAFYNYLRQQKVTHVVVPKSFDKRGEIFYKWGKHGSVKLKLARPYFERELATDGENPVILYKVSTVEIFDQLSPVPNYYMKWENFDGSFYGVQVSWVKNVFDYEYTYKYLDGEDITWIVWDDPEFSIYEPDKAGAIYSVEIVLASAYGPTGFPQIVGVMDTSVKQIVKLEPGKPKSLFLNLRANEKVRLKTFLPCQEARQFDPANDSSQLFCYGISDIRVRLKN